MQYLDASAIVKLVSREPETSHLVEAVRADPQLISSALSWTEVVRAVRRAGGNVARAEAVLGGIALVPIDEGLLREAAVLAPSNLRTLDAIHAATAISLGPDVDRVVAYDARLLEAAAAAGLAVESPGAAML